MKKAPRNVVTTKEIHEVFGPQVTCCGKEILVKDLRLAETKPPYTIENENVKYTFRIGRMAMCDCGHVFMREWENKVIK